MPRKETKSHESVSHLPPYPSCSRCRCHCLWVGNRYKSHGLGCCCYWLGYTVGNGEETMTTEQRNRPVSTTTGGPADVSGDIPSALWRILWSSLISFSPEAPQPLETRNKLPFPQRVKSPLHLPREDDRWTATLKGGTEKKG